MNFGPSFSDILESIALQNFFEQLQRGQRHGGGATVTELNDDVTSSSKHDERSVKSSLEKIMKLEEQSASYFEEGKFHEAYGVLKSQHSHGSKIYFAPVLVKFYVSLIKTERTEEADKIRDELVSTLGSKFRDSPEDTCSYADSLRMRGEYCQALLFYQVSMHYAEKNLNPRFVELPQNIVQGIRHSSLKMFERNLISKKMLQTYVIPILLKVREDVKKIIAFDTGLSALIQSVVLETVQVFQFLSGDLVAQGTTLKEAITLIRHHYGRNGGQQFKLYGHLMKRLGIVCTMLNKPTDASKMFKQALAALKKAKDFDSPLEKAEEVQKLQERVQKLSNTTSTQ